MGKVAPAVLEGTFGTALTRPPVIAGGSLVTLESQIVNTVIKPGENTTAFGYQANRILGPTIEISTGDNFQANFNNGLTEASNIHWHGLITPPEMDGHPNDLVQSSSSFTYAFPVINRAGMYWYHPHPDLATAKQTYLGMAGLFRITDAEEQALNLPSGEFELPLIIQDKLLNADADLVYAPDETDLMNGLMGDHILVNGLYAPYQNVATRMYRLRLLNGSNGRIYNLELSTGAQFQIIGSDGGLLAFPETTSRFLLSPGERIDILVDFAGMAIGTEVFLQSAIFSGSDYQGKQAFNILKFVVTESQPDSFTLPSILSAYQPIPENQAIRNRSFDVSNGGGHGGHTGGMVVHNINNKSYDESRIDEIITGGTTEIWTFDNTEGIDPHPMHLHGAIFQVLDRSGGRGIVFPHENGWKDTVLTMPGEKVRIIIQFGQNKGVYVFHCHNLEHEDSGMMLQLEIQ